MKKNILSVVKLKAPQEMMAKTPLFFFGFKGNLNEVPIRATPNIRSLTQARQVKIIKII